VRPAHLYEGYTPAEVVFGVRVMGYGACAAWSSLTPPAASTSRMPGGAGC